MFFFFFFLFVYMPSARTENTVYIKHSILMIGCLFRFYGISTIGGYSNPFYENNSFSNNSVKHKYAV